MAKLSLTIKQVPQGVMGGSDPALNLTKINCGGQALQKTLTTSLKHYRGMGGISSVYTLRAD